MQRAADEQRPVEVRRRRGWTRLEGYVAAVDDEWSALRVVEDGAPDGLSLLRTADVRRLRRAPDARTALHDAGQWPPRVPELLDLYDVRTVLFTAGSLAPVLAVAAEEVAPGTFWVGSVLRITDTDLELRELLPGGTWNPEPQSWPLDGITRVDLGSAYVRGLQP